MKYKFLSFLFLLLYELKRMIKASISSYIWFVVLLSIATYTLSGEEYVEIEVEQSFMGLEYGNAPMQDIIIFVSSFVVSSISEIFSGVFPEMMFPVTIGVGFFIIFPLMLALTMIGRFITKRAVSSIAGDKEKKTLYILVSSPLTRPSIYVGKFIAIFILSLPMLVTLYFVTNWAFTNLFPTQTNQTWQVFKASVITAFLFSSIGMFVSVLRDQEKKALKLGLRIVNIAVFLTILWIFIPVIELILNLTNSSVFLLLLLEKITYVSPFTMSLLSVYNPEIDFFNIQIITIAIFLILGTAIFIRQDLEY